MSIKSTLKKTCIVTGVICLFILVAALIIMSQDNLRFKLDYESLNHIPYENGKKISVKIPLDNKVKYIRGKEVLEVLKTKTGIIYFGYNSCPWCRNIVEPLIEIAKENKIEPIYYVDVHREIDGIELELKEILDPYLREDEETKQKVLAFPDVYFIKDGKIIGHHISTVKSYKNPYKGMTQEQENELKEIYQALAKEMKR